MTTEEQVRQLLKHGYISTAYQPIVNLENGGIVGYEALMRGPKDTPLSHPGWIFGPSSRVSDGLIQDLDAACIAASLRSGHMLVPAGDLFINVHISTLLHLRKMQSLFENLLDSSGIPPEAVVIEISERTKAPNPRALSRILRTLRRRGFRFALDDFGQAFSGLQHLLWFEPEFIKIDRAFVLGIQRSARKQALVAGVATMAQKLGGQVVAEGVETSEELLTLMALDVPMAQGYHFGRPQSALFWTAEGKVKAIFRPWFQAGAAPGGNGSAEGGGRGGPQPVN